MIFNAGRLDRRITIERKIGTTTNKVGEPVPTWAEVAKVWAEFRAPSGIERFVAQREDAEVRGIFLIRWRSDIDEEMRINFDGNVYDIEAILPIGRRNGLEVRTTARREDGEAAL